MLGHFEQGLGLCYVSAMYGTYDMYSIGVVCVTDVCMYVCVVFYLVCSVCSQCSS